MAAKPKALVAKKGGQQIILVVPKDLKTSIGNSKNKIEAENSLQQGATNPFAEDHSPPSSPNHFHRWKSLLQLHWIWTAIAWSSHPQSFPVSLKLITDETQFFWQIFLPIFLEAHHRWDPATIFCKYLGQYFFEAHHRWGPANIFQLVTKLGNPSWTKTQNTDWFKFPCSFSVSRDVAQKSCWHQTILINFYTKSEVQQLSSF